MFQLPQRLHRPLAIMGALSALALVAPAPTAARAVDDRSPDAGYDQCVLDYQRADNMWAAAGRPDGGLGVETISLQPGQSKTFLTDWKYEKLRNDGTTYYGSHLRIATNKGGLRVMIELRYDALHPPVWHTLLAGTLYPTSADLMQVTCLSS